MLSREKLGRSWRTKNLFPPTDPLASLPRFLSYKYEKQVPWSVTVSFTPPPFPIIPSPQFPVPASLLAS